MKRTITTKFSVACWVVGLSLLLLPSAVQAQSAQSTPTTAQPIETATPERALSNIGVAAASVATTATVTATGTSVAAPVLLPTPTPVADPDEPEVMADVTAVAAPLVGTTFNNLTDYPARFFLEGSTYLVRPGASLGVQLPRQTSVLNLYNCDAGIAESQACFWDPYLVQSEGLYDIYAPSAQNESDRLMLRESGAPPDDQVWVQNRTAQVESVVFRGEVHELPAAALHEFPVISGAPAILYVRHCLSLDERSVCEWTPKALEAGAFYALVDSVLRGAVEGSTVSSIELRPVVGGKLVEVVDAEPLGEGTSPGGQNSCRLDVPVLNVRGGPGMQYPVIDKIRSDGPTPTVVIVTGRSVDNQWLTVSPTIIEGGWITSGAGFVTCSANLANLPLVEAPPLPEPVPAPVVQPLPETTESPTEQPDVPAGTENDGTTDAGEPEEAGQDAPQATVGMLPGQGLLQVHNSFQHEMRVTIDQRYRPIDGPSEYDLQPGATINVVVFPGTISFTVSSAWRSLSRNTTIEVAPDSSVPLWLRFELDGSGSWYLVLE